MTTEKNPEAGNLGAEDDDAGSEIDVSMLPPAVEQTPDVEDRQGLKRVTVARSSSGRCHNCARVFETLAGTISHGRSAAHVVEGTYAATYVYVPSAS